MCVFLLPACPRVRAYFGVGVWGESNALPRVWTSGGYISISGAHGLVLITVVVNEGEEEGSFLVRYRLCN